MVTLHPGDGLNDYLMYTKWCSMNTEYLICAEWILNWYFIDTKTLSRTGQEIENEGLVDQHGTILTIQLVLWVVGLLAM